MALEQGREVTADDYNELFKTLEALREKHYNRDGLTEEQKENLGKPLGRFVDVGEKAASANIAAIRSALSLLGTFAPDLNTSFASNIIIPKVGSLLRASSLKQVQTELGEAYEDVCPNCSFDSAFFASHHNSFNSSHCNFCDFSCNFESSYRHFGSFNSSWNGRFC